MEPRMLIRTRFVKRITAKGIFNTQLNGGPRTSRVNVQTISKNYGRDRRVEVLMPRPSSHTVLKVLTEGSYASSISMLGHSNVRESILGSLFASMLTVIVISLLEQLESVTISPEVRELNAITGPSAITFVAFDGWLCISPLGISLDIWSVGEIAHCEMPSHVGLMLNTWVSSQPLVYDVECVSSTVVTP